MVQQRSTSNGASRSYVNSEYTATREDLSAALAGLKAVRSPDNQPAPLSQTDSRTHENRRTSAFEGGGEGCCLGHALRLHAGQRGRSSPRPTRSM